MIDRISALWAYRPLIGNLARRELQLKYRGSFLGWTWSLLTPMLTLLIYGLVFGVILDVDPRAAGNPEVRSFPLFLFCGLVIWGFVSGVITRSMGWLIEAGPLLNKAYFPPEASILAGSVGALVQVCLEVIVLTTALAIVGNVGLETLMIVPVVVLLAIMTIGIALLLSLLNVFFRDVGHLVGVGLTLLFYATPIVYPIELVPEKAWGWLPAFALIRLNPVTQYVEASRDVLYDLEVPSPERLLALALTSLLFFVIGSAVFARFSARLSEEF